MRGYPEQSEPVQQKRTDGETAIQEKRLGLHKRIFRTFTSKSPSKITEYIAFEEKHRRRI